MWVLQTPKLLLRTVALEKAQTINEGVGSNYFESLLVSFFVMFPILMVPFHLPCFFFELISPALVFGNRNAQLVGGLCKCFCCRDRVIYSHPSSLQSWLAPISSIAFLQRPRFGNCYCWYSHITLIYPTGHITSTLLLGESLTQLVLM